jgi:ketosteroid isomerase-like protein
MKHLRRLTLAVLAFGFPAAAQAQLPSLTQADISAIESTLTEWCDTALAGDLERWVATYTDQALEIMQNGRANISKASIEVRVAPWFRNGTFTRCVNTVVSTQGTGGVAQVVASTDQGWRNTATGVETDYAYNWAVTMEKEADGVWRIAVMKWMDVE